MQETIERLRRMLAGEEYKVADGATIQFPEAMQVELTTSGDTLRVKFTVGKPRVSFKKFGINQVREIGALRIKGNKVRPEIDNFPDWLEPEFEI